jgi:hypothetical protein
MGLRVSWMGVRDTGAWTGDPIMAEKRSAAGSGGFRARKGYVRPDGRGRLTLGSAAMDTDYRVLVNERGQILLDPVVPIPASENWLWENPSLRASMERALKQAAGGEFEELGSFAQFVDEDE